MKAVGFVLGAVFQFAVAVFIWYATAVVLGVWIGLVYIAARWVIG